MKPVADQRDCVHLLLGHRDARGIPAGVEFGPDPEPGLRPGAPERSTMVSYVVNGVPRQFAVM